MRVLLVNPWIHDFAAYDLWAKPIGILKIASYLSKAGCEISFIDCLDRLHPSLNKFLNGKSPKSTQYGSGHYYSEEIIKPEVFRSISRTFKRYGYPPELFGKLLNEIRKPDIILVTSGMTYWYPGVFETIKALKQNFPDAPLMLGGIYATLCHEHAKKHSNADLVFKGNNIAEIISFINKITDNKLDIPFLKKENGIFPLYELYPELSYITLRTSNGCPFRCSYCGWYLIEEKFEQDNPDFIVENIEYFNKKNKIKDFAFYDDALLFNAEKHIIKILENITRKNIKANFHTPNGLHARLVTLGVAKLMKTANFISPRLALETINEKRQMQTGFKTSTGEFLKAVEYFKKAGYSSKDIAVNILIGLPGQDLGEVKDSIEFAGKLDLKIHLEEYSPIPGTLDFERSGLTADSDPLLHNNSVFPLYKPPDYSIIQSMKILVNDLNKRH